MKTNDELGGCLSVRNACKEFEAVQARYRDTGANDSEPDYVFQHLLLEALKGKRPVCPEDNRGWNLYSPECAAEEIRIEAAVKALSAAASIAIKCVEQTRVYELKELKRLIKNYCWRFN